MYPAMKVHAASLITFLSIVVASAQDRTIDIDSVTEESCIDTPDWADADYFTCEWYEANDAQGCPIYGDLRPWRYKDGEVYEAFGDGTANDNCCHCKGTASPTPKPTSSCSGDTPGWKDIENYTCAWYEAYDTKGCPRLGDAFGGSMGVANDNCCWCQGDGTLTTTTAYPTIALVPTTSPFG